MSLKDIASLGKMLAQFLLLFSDCFRSCKGRNLLAVYVKGLLSDVQRKNVEAIALDQDVPPRTLQRFLESIKWDERRLRDRCQQIIARDYADPEAIGCIDETGTAKSGKQTVGVKRQYNGNRGKVDNAVVNVALSYTSKKFHCLLDARLYLPKEWAEDPKRRAETHVPDEIEFQTKPQIALDLIDGAKANGITVLAWTFDELYGRGAEFLDGLDNRGEAFVGEIPPDFRVWLEKPKKRRNPPKTGNKNRFRRSLPQSSQVQHVRKHSPSFYDQTPQLYRIKDTERGAEVWEIRWHTCWRKIQDERGVSNQCTLIVARNVRTGEWKYFLSNQVPGRRGWTVRAILRVAFGRWDVEGCFRESKEELGWDHFECRGWRCVHRHLCVTILSQLFCARVRAKLCEKNYLQGGESLTMEQVRRAINVYLGSCHLPRSHRRRCREKELSCQHYYQSRNAQARRSHTKTRRRKLAELGIDSDSIKSVNPRTP